MQQGSDYGYYSPHYPRSYPTTNPNPSPNPNPGEYPPSNLASASAPPYSHYAGADYPSYPAPYPSYSHTPDPASNLPPSAPSYTQPQPQPQPTQYPPSYPSYNPSPYPSEQPAASYSQPHPPSSIPPYPHDPYPPAGNHGLFSNPNPNPNPSPSFSPYPSYENPYESTATAAASKFDHYGLGMTGAYRRSSLGFEPDSSGGVYRYDGGGSEPYGARGIGGSARSSVVFDDFGRSVSFSSSGKEQSVGTGKIVRAVPKTEVQQDVKSGVQKFRVKLLAEGSGQSTMDVLCQIGLDGIRMLDPSTSRTLRIYPLETVTRWDVSDPSIYSFWSKSSVDVEPRRIRLKSNSYTTSTLLDTVAAATVQLKEMGGKESLSSSKGSSDVGKQFELPNEKRKGFDWMNFIKPANEEKDHWVPDEAVTKCTSCGVDFSAFVRKHHCRNCGDIFCDKCTHGRIALTADENAQPVRVCDRCMAEVTQRLSNAKEVASRSAAVHSHEDLAKKLQEEMDKNRRSSGSKSSDGSGRRMREVACPTCTVHLQVQVPASGSETIECGVCQHPFLVSAH